MEKLMDDEIVISNEFELIAQAMVQTRGDLSKASRFDQIDYNAMSLRAVVKSNPEIRARYHVLLAEEMQEKGLHIAERILNMASLQEEAMGKKILITNEAGDLEEMDVPTDIKTVIELSKEISRLIAEGKGQPMSAKSAMVLASKEDAKDLLESFLNS
jgi:hypothetical protein